MAKLSILCPSNEVILTSIKLESKVLGSMPSYSVSVITLAYRIQQCAVMIYHWQFNLHLKTWTYDKKKS